MLLRVKLTTRAIVSISAKCRERVYRNSNCLPGTRHWQQRTDRSQWCIAFDQRGTGDQVLFAPSSVALLSKLGGKRSSNVGAIHRVEHATCVICDGSGHKPKHRGWKIVAHSLNDA